MKALGLVAGLLFALGTLPAAATAASDTAETSDAIQLTDVLVSVSAHFPLLRAAEAERAIAAGTLRSAEGRFDTRFVSEGDLRPIGFYENYANNTYLEQPTRLWGARLFGGYRIGQGEFPSYEGGRKTNNDGEVRAGLAVPLLRDGRIDTDRAQLRKAELGVQRAEPLIELERIGFERDASIAYWNWVAAGLAVDVSARLVEVAEQRQRQIEGRVARGAIPRIDLVDNERLIVDRRVQLQGAERDAEQAAIQLSLYLRDGDGAPLVAPRERLPERFPEEEAPQPDRFREDVARATEAHPLLRRFELEIRESAVELELARNQLLPGLELRIEGSKDAGASSKGIDSSGSLSLDPKDDAVLKALVRFELPVQQREAKGRVASASAKLARLESRARFARERIEAEIRQAMAALEAAHAQTEGARRNLELAQQLRRAEQRKLELGSSDLLAVNIREVQAAGAGFDLIETQARYFRARAEYDAAIGGGSP